jgi:endonuclease/exonuclease/phosphatase family metal-dependent hydrolase
MLQAKSLLAAGDLNAKHPFWNSAVSSPSGAKLLDSMHINESQISAPHCPTNYSSAGNGEAMDIVVHKNVRLSEVIASDILDSDHLPIVFHLLDHARTMNLSDTVDNFTDWERFQSLAAELISPRMRP